jgi:N-methylhydantoinase A/oxoprolinase/acetone carboxylase beta subunit
MQETVRYTIELDTGGTFTDGYVSGGGEAVRSKVDTTPHDLTEGILRCIDQAASQLGTDRSGLLRQTDVVRLSTTVATNALINRSGAKVGLLAGDDLYESVVARLPETLPLARNLVEKLPSPKAPEAAAATVKALRSLLEHGARIVVIALADGPDLAARERAVRAFIAAEYPRHYLGAVPIVTSHEVTLSRDSVVRVSTAVLDAYLHPVMSRFLYRVEDELRRSGSTRPLLVAQSNGGSSRVAKTTAIRTWGSGPAGGVAGAAALARELGLETVVAIDVGGTSSDVSIVVDGAWRYAVEPTIDGVTVSLPVLELDSIGIGGGSIAAVSGGELAVGPRSAGAQPGPAAFGLGGAEATVTDAACVLGFFDPANFLGGRKTLDVAAAERILDRTIAKPLGASVETAAHRILRQAAHAVARDVRRLLAERGLDAAKTWLFATGGAGGLLAAPIAAEASLAGFLAFPLSPVFSAFGLSRLDLLHVYETRVEDDLRTALEGLSERALRDMRGEGADLHALSLTLEAETENGDGSVQAVDLGDAADLGAVVDRAAKHRETLRLLRLKASVPGRRAVLPRRESGTIEPRGSRAVVWHGTAAKTPVYDWDSLRAGATIAGPAIFESGDTTVPVPPATIVRVGALGEIRVTRTA